jgi:hypothetical protein
LGQRGGGWELWDDDDEDWGWGLGGPTLVAYFAKHKCRPVQKALTFHPPAVITGSSSAIQSATSSEKCDVITTHHHTPTHHANRCMATFVRRIGGRGPRLGEGLTGLGQGQSYRASESPQVVERG